MQLSLEVTGIEGMETAVETLLQNVPRATADAMNRIGLLLVGYAQRSIMEHQSSGRVYGKRFYKGDRVDFVASLPGYPPNSQHGGAGLVGSIQYEIDENDLSLVVGTNLKYGAYLEFGTQHMEARPWLFPALETSKEAIEKILDDTLRDGLE